MHFITGTRLLYTKKPMQLLAVFDIASSLCVGGQKESLPLHVHADLLQIGMHCSTIKSFQMRDIS